MFQSKPILIMRTLDAADLRRFEEFLESPYFNRNDRVPALFALLRPFAPDFDAPEIERTQVYDQLFENEVFDDKKFRYLMTDLAKLLEEFLSVTTFRDNPFYFQHFLLKSYKDRKLDKYFESAFKRLEQAQDKLAVRDVDHLYKSYLLAEDRYRFISSRKDHLAKTNLQQVVDNLDTYYLANKLKYCCEILNNKDVVNVDYELRLLDEIKTYLHSKQMDLNSLPSIAVYYQVLLTLTESENKQHYLDLLDLLDSNEQYFSPAELFDLYVYAKNYCIIKINRGYVEYIREMFDFYKIILEKRIIFKGGYLSQWDYKNIVTLGLRLGEYKWVEDFMNTYREELDPGARENAWQYNMANLRFYQGNYDQTLALLQSVAFTDVYYALDSKSLLLKSYFELGEWEPLTSLVSAFKVYLKRNRLIPEYQRTVYSNLIHFVNQLVRYRRGRKVSLQELRDEIEGRKQVADLTWLRTQVDALEAEVRAPIR